MYHFPQQIGNASTSEVISNFSCHYLLSTRFLLSWKKQRSGAGKTWVDIRSSVKQTFVSNPSMIFWPHRLKGQWVVPPPPCGPWSLGILEKTVGTRHRWVYCVLVLQGKDPIPLFSHFSGVSGTGLGSKYFSFLWLL